MPHLVFLLEAPSARDALEIWIPQWLSTETQAHFIVFQGKQDLEKQMARRMRGWLLPDSRFIVLRDQGSGDCHQIKHSLQERCLEAGRTNALVRIACRELETFFVGDWQAVANAFGKPALRRLANRARYRNPDALESPSQILQHHVAGYQKRDGARRIAPWIEPARNRSRSDHALRDGVLAVANSMN